MHSAAWEIWSWHCRSEAPICRIVSQCTAVAVHIPVSTNEWPIERIWWMRQIHSADHSIVLLATRTAIAVHCETILYIGASLLQCQLQIFCAAGCIRAKCCYYLPVAVQNRLFGLIFRCFQAQSITMNFKKNREHSIPCKQYCYDYIYI
jgi:hypothetical protein